MHGYLVLKRLLQLMFVTALFRISVLYVHSQFSCQAIVFVERCVLEKTHLKHVTGLALHTVIEVTGLSATFPYHAVVSVSYYQGAELMSTKSGNPRNANKRPYSGFARQDQEVLPDQNDNAIGHRSINHGQCTTYHRIPYTRLCLVLFGAQN